MQRDDHPHHVTARRWFTDLLARQDAFSVPWLVWWSFLRLSTNRRVFKTVTPTHEALKFISAVCAQPNHVAVNPGSRHFQCLQIVCENAEASGDLVPDAVLAAIAVEHGCEVVSFDRDFARFSDIKWVRPTAS